MWIYSPGHEESLGRSGFDEGTNVLNAPRGDFLTQLHWLREAPVFYPGPPCGFTDGKNFEYCGQADKACFWKNVVGHFSVLLLLIQGQLMLIY